MSTTQKQPRGCANSSAASLSRTVLSMRGQLPKSMRGTYKDILNAISSLALEDGASPCSLPDGPQTDLFGRALVPASHSAPQAKASPKPTNATSGPCSSISSASAALSMSLGNRLQARLGTDGSMEYRQTWKQKATPAGRPYWAHIPSTRPINDKGSTGWPSPIKGDEKCRISNIGMAEKRLASGKQTSLELVAHLTGWCSPTVTDADRGVLPPRPQDTGIPLTQQIAGLTGWATPMAATNNPQAHGSSNTDFQREVETAFGLRESKNSPKVSGLTSSSSTAETGKPAASQLNPHFSRWLMGFPPEWCDCAVTAMQSFPKSRRSSSKHVRR